MSKIYQFIKNKFSSLGAGFITGAADDDPSGVATYSIAGAQFGYRLNWLFVFLTPMMIVIQEMCGRIGMCSGLGLTGVIKKFYSQKLLFFAVSLLLIANIINISADLGIMAACLEMILGLPFLIWLAFITATSIFMEVFISYKRYSGFLRWMSLILLMYWVTALIVKQDWLEILNKTFIPHLEFNLMYLMTAVAFIGTTISPYLFFWQASEEVEEEIKDGKINEFGIKPMIFKKDILGMKRDTIIGMVFSNLVALAIIITTAATLNFNGITNIETPQQVALALKPFAGNFAFLLFTIGIIGIGLQSVPVLAGGVAYSLSEILGRKEGLSKKFHQAKLFYIILALATLIGALFNFVGINPVKALYYTAIINGLISVPLIFIIIRIADNEKVVGHFRSSKLSRSIGWLTFIFVGLASFLMIINLFQPLLNFFSNLLSFFHF